VIFLPLPDLGNVRYDFDNQQFEDRLGRPLRPDWAKTIGASANARALRAGEATLRRSVFLESLVSSPSSEKSELLERIRDNGGLELAGLNKVFGKTTL
jgi:hypothetical protein